MTVRTDPPAPNRTGAVAAKTNRRRRPAWLLPLLGLLALALLALALYALLHHSSKKAAAPAIAPVAPVSPSAASSPPGLTPSASPSAAAGSASPGAGAGGAARHAPVPRCCPRTAPPAGGLVLAHHGRLLSWLSPASAQVPWTTLPPAELIFLGRLLHQI